MTLLEMQVEKVNKNTQGATSEEIQNYLEQLPKWEKIAVGGEERIQREYTFDDFRDALDYTVEVGEMAEEIN
ncbi:MAG: 4a-hydroxytetrahydrobiopterin dehydratase, partial [Gammaproteobacteria bacterium]|nr:4a-hydroxytetrahydrobiopterin dehydratase [Gammaproteobacteria bacterium]